MAGRLEVFGRAVEILRENGYDATLQGDYSGRGMFGDTTPAIVTDRSGVLVGWAITTACVELEMGEPWQSFEVMPSRVDSMGLGTVFY